KNNIEWAHRLEDAGCRVIYGLMGFKVHSKVCLITRREHGKLNYITQIGTGNYNEKTAKLYTDLSLITANREIGRDAADFFSNLMLGNLEGEYKRLTELAGSLERLQADYHAEAETLEKRRQESQAAIEAAAREIELFNRQNAEVEAELAAAADDRTGTIQQREALSDEIGEIKLETLAFIKEMEAHRQAIGELQDRRENAAGFCEELERQIAGLTDTNDKIEEQIAEQQAAAAGLRERGAGSDREIREWMEKHAGCETEQTALRQRIREKSDEREKLSRETVRLEERLAAAGRETDEILERLYTEYNLTRTEAEDLGIIIEDIPRANRRLSELRGKIRALGDVNVGAIEEYKEVGRRYEFLRGQVQDIEISREELRKLIAELTGQMCELFIERFKQINHYFGEVFAELFGGGSAKCTLTDESDILGAGIEMDVQPPGKNVRNLDSLSGGEKALVATALLFAILKVTPSPFCVLDEIDAPLDEVNTDRFAAYLRRMCRNTQFIVITHRRGTMEEADILYGVTMQEEGVSKLLSLRASEVEEKLGMSMKINA
ncbi:MAG: hypothetical protein FWE80_07370, partial [Oscillospiraceae bacterium]|nr:hypothetical protein [Oscillospiraceae bacterium]